MVEKMHKAIVANKLEQRLGRLLSEQELKMLSYQLHGNGYNFSMGTMMGYVKR